eukprot:symbB.v1.2.007007.t1/scaffold385.1/size305797/3
MSFTMYQHMALKQRWAPLKRSRRQNWRRRSGCQKASQINPRSRCHLHRGPLWRMLRLMIQVGLEAQAFSETECPPIGDLWPVPSTLKVSASLDDVSLHKPLKMRAST